MRLALAALGTAAVVVVVGVAQGWWQGAKRIAPPRRPVVATATLSTRALAFGDRLGARLDLLVDPAAVDPATIRVRPRFSPYRVVGTSRKKRTAGAVLISYRYALECLSGPCVPEHAGSTVQHRFLPVLVSYRSPSGEATNGTVEWPPYQLASRITDADRAGSAERLQGDAPLPPISYRIGPATLRAVQTALSAILALAAAGLLAIAFWRRRAHLAADGPTLSPLRRALMRVRASSANGGPPGERRKALGHLGRELRAVDHDELARDAGRLAWSADNPSPESAGAFAAQVEASFGDQQ